MKLNTIILAAGQGTRMRSELPKVLHKLGAWPLLEHVYNTARSVQEGEITVIYGHGGEKVVNSLDHLEAGWIEQKEQLGTGHAVMQVADLIEDDDTVLILYGDVPLLKAETLNRLTQCMANTQLAVLTVNLDDPSGYGRIVRNTEGRIERIVEEKDASASEKLLSEVNTGILAADGGKLKQWLSALDNNNAQGEFYLTDIIAMAVSEGITVETTQATSADEVLGVNNRQQLAYLERVFQLEQANKLMELGVTLRDPHRFDLRGRINSIGRDVEIDVNVVLEGEINIGNGVRIGPNCVIKDATIHGNVDIFANCHIEDATIGAACRVGPYSRLRPATVLSEKVHVGNFVEIKKSEVSIGSKINHLSYIGDSNVGSEVNIGAGTITCNYDGANKFKTIIEDGVFVGSDTQLIAPVRIAKNSTIGAGSTITSDTPADKLSLSRAKQISIDGWQRPKKRG